MAAEEKAYRRQRRAYKALTPLIRFLMGRLVGYRAIIAPPTEGPCLILSNHVTDLDPILVGLSFPEHMYYVAGENVMRMGLLSRIVERYASLIQRVKGTTDAEAALSILRTLKKGRNVCMFAEGNRTFTGVTGPIAPATAKLVRLSRATLITYRLTGGYLTSPRWSTHLRRGKMEGAVVNVYPPEAIRAMSEEQILSFLRADLYENAYERQKEAPVAYRGRALAQTLETALYLCPKCRKIGSLRSKGDRFFCSCGLNLRLNRWGAFEGDRPPFENPLLWDEWQQAQMEALANSLGEAPAFCDEGQTLNLRRSDHSLQPLTTGTMSLYRDRLTLGAYVFPLEQIREIALIQRQGMVFSTGKGDYVITAKKLRCVRKYQNLFALLKARLPQP